MKSIDHERRELMSLHHAHRQCARDTAVAVSKGVDLNEAMMEPRGDDHRVDTFELELLVPLCELVDLGIDMLGRAILQQGAISPLYMVGLLLPAPVRQLAFDYLPEQIRRGIRSLCACDRVVELLDEGGG